VGDAITYELTYDHKVAPETLMDLPEDQMLAPQVAERHSLERHGPEVHGAEVHGAEVHGAEVDGGDRWAGESRPVGEAGNAVLKGPAESKMIALVVDPAVVGTESVAHVRSHEIPAYQPPATPPPAPAIGPGR
jgi:hypothetical protein